MSDIKLFNIKGNVSELRGSNVALEKELQSIIENNMEKFFGVRFLKSEYPTTNGRMDSIGIDENNCPVIFEYKRKNNENVINQGLFYLNWLLDHKDSFKLLVLETLGDEIANDIDWSSPRIICVAGDFNKYDESAINQMNRNISLVRYKKYKDDLLLFEYLNQNFVKPIEDEEVQAETKTYKYREKTPQEILEANPNVKVLFDNLRDYLYGNDPDINLVYLRYYVAFKKFSNVACVSVRKSDLLMFLPLDTNVIDTHDSNVRDVSNIGHRGTGDVEVSIKNQADFEIAKKYIDKLFQN